MGDTFTVKATGFREMVAAMNAIEAGVKGAGLNDLVTEVGAALLNRIRTRFLAEQDPDGAQWIPSTHGERRKAGGKTFRVVKGVKKSFTGTGTLFETGALFHSIQLGQATGGEVGIGTDVPYAGPLQRGEDGQPVRIFLGFGGDDVKLATDIIDRRIASLLERGGK